MKSALVVLVLLFATAAEAGVEVRLFSITTLPDGTYHYGYRVRLVSGRLDPGSPVSQILTLYDVPGIIPGSLSATAPWGGVLQFTGNDANDIPRSGYDNPSLYNVTLKYTGASVIVAPADVGSFSFRAPTGATIPLVYIGQSTGQYSMPAALIGRTGGPR